MLNKLLFLTLKKKQMKLNKQLLNTKETIDQTNNTKETIDQTNNTKEVIEQSNNKHIEQILDTKEIIEQILDTKEIIEQPNNKHIDQPLDTKESIEPIYNKTNKCLIILVGECFREGRCESRTCDTDFGYEKQKECTQTHNDLITKLQKLNYNVDIAFNTYNTKYKNELLSWYKGNIIYNNFVSENYGFFRNVVDKSLQNIMKNVDFELYDFVFITRFDIYLKEKLISIFNPDWQTMMYPFAVYIEYESSPLVFPFVTDTMCFIPQKYLSKIKKNTQHLIHHHCWRDLINNGFSLDDLDVMVNTLHNPNTQAELNYLYKINCRDEYPTWFQINKYYDKQTNSIKNNL
jgi:hypothetical protein